MKRILAMIMIVLGSALAFAGLKGMVAAGVGVGGFLLVAGTVLFGISFISRPALTSGAPLPLTPFRRIAGMFYAPSTVFEDLRAHPTWLLPFLIITLCTVTYNIAYTRRLTPEVITGAAIDKALEGQSIPQSQVAAIKQQQLESAKSPLTQVWFVVIAGSGLFVFMVALAALFLFGIIVSGGQINFWRALAVAYYAVIPPVLIHSLLSLVLLYAKSPDDINPIRGQHGLVRDSLNILFSPDAHPVLYTMASYIGFVSLYGLWLTATGLGKVSERTSNQAAWGVAVTLWMLNLGFNVIVAALYPKFI